MIEKGKFELRLVHKGYQIRSGGVELGTEHLYVLQYSIGDQPWTNVPLVQFDSLTHDESMVASGRQPP